MSLPELRQDYGRGHLDESDLLPDPIAQFSAWFDEALARGVPERREQRARERIAHDMPFGVPLHSDRKALCGLNPE